MRETGLPNFGKAPKEEKQDFSILGKLKNGRNEGSQSWDTPRTRKNSRLRQRLGISLIIFNKKNP